MTVEAIIVVNTNDDCGMYDILYELKEWIAYFLWHSLYNMIQRRVGLLMTLVLIFF